MWANLPEPLSRIRVVHIFEADEEPLIYLATTERGQCYFVFLGKEDDDWQYWNYLLLSREEAIRVRTTRMLVLSLFQDSETGVLLTAQFHRWEDVPTTVAIASLASLLERAAPICRVELNAELPPGAGRGAALESERRSQQALLHDAQRFNSIVIQLRLQTHRPESTYVPIRAASTLLLALPQVLTKMQSAKASAESGSTHRDWGLDVGPAAEGSHIINIRGPQMGLLLGPKVGDDPLSRAVSRLWELLSAVPDPNTLLPILGERAAVHHGAISSFLGFVRGLQASVATSDIAWAHPAGQYQSVQLRASEVAEATRRVREQQWREPIEFSAEGRFHRFDILSGTFSFQLNEDGTTINGRASAELMRRLSSRKTSVMVSSGGSDYSVTFRVLSSKGLISHERYVALRMLPITP